MRHRLVHPQGNFGSIAGLPPAAMRYTEARLSPSPPRCSHDLERDTVDFIDNYDGKYREPLVLPSKFPNLLVNGSDGIAVGMATDIPPHNLARGLRRPDQVIDDPDVTHRRTDGDHPRPRLPHRRHHLRPAGHLRRLPHRPRQDHPPRPRRHQRGRQPQRRSSSTKCRIQQTRNRLAEPIGELVKDERIKGIGASATNERPDGEPVRLVIDLKRDADPRPGPQPALPVLAAAEDA